MKYLNSKLIPFLVLALVLLVAGCASCNMEAQENPPGFWYGLLHGFILLFSFVASLFTDYCIYSIPNSGPWYDFGFLLGIMFFFGGGAKAGRRKKHGDCCKNKDIPEAEVVE